MTQEPYDIAIIGGGPVGMFAAFYASLRDTKVVLIESLAMLGGQVMSLYPEKKILDVAGFPGVKGVDFIAALEQQLAMFPVDVKLNTTVTDVAQVTDGFQLTTQQGDTIQAKTVIITTGKGAFEPRKMQVDGVEELVGHGVHYFVTDKQSFKNHTIAIAGGGDSAVDMAVMLNDIAATTHIIHRRETFRAMEQSVNALQASAVIQETPQKIVAIDRLENGQLQLTLAHVKDTTQQHVLVVDDLIINYGFISESKTIQGWTIQPALANHGFAVNQEMQTDIPGVFAIGDANHYVGKTDLIAVGFGETPSAVNAAIRYFDPHRGGPVHSSSLVF
ncbi:MAG: NAD(P)/FAD-dependent oxidoreductase [Leuconostoc sp.]|uniref:NAD(P)/FAD-dependent oxidoreductase n=1 Tax=Leuconostoc sp. TaxID=1930076 RepID=UPI0039E91747